LHHAAYGVIRVTVQTTSSPHSGNPFFVTILYLYKFRIRTNLKITKNQKKL